MEIFFKFDSISDFFFALRITQIQSMKINLLKNTMTFMKNVILTLTTNFHIFQCNFYMLINMGMTVITTHCTSTHFYVV